MKKIVKSTLTSLLALPLVLLTGCNKEDYKADSNILLNDIDFGSYLFVNDGQRDLNSKNFILAQEYNMNGDILMKYPDADSVAFYVRLNSALSKDVTINAKLDDGLAQAHTPGGTVLPSGAVELSRASVTVPAGKVVSSSPIVAKLVRGEAYEKLEGTGIFAVSISTDSGIKISEKYSSYHASVQKTAPTNGIFFSTDTDGLEQLKPETDFTYTGRYVNSLGNLFDGVVSFDNFGYMYPYYSSTVTFNFSNPVGIKAIGFRAVPGRLDYAPGEGRLRIYGEGGESIPLKDGGVLRMEKKDENVWYLIRFFAPQTAARIEFSPMFPLMGGYNYIYVSEIGLFK